MSDKLVNIRLQSPGFMQHVKAVSGLFLATKGESLTDLELRLLFFIKFFMKEEGIDHINRRVRAKLVHRFELRPQTLYNKLSDLKRKGALISNNNKSQLHPLLGDNLKVEIGYNYASDRKMQDAFTGGE